MYYKLPIKDRMDLMKSYKKANPKMSYNDMVNDYNDSYQKFGNGGEKPKLKPKDFAAEKTNYEEQTRGASQADGSGISSAELAYKFSKLIDTSGLTSVTEIGKNAYLGNKQDPIDYLGLLRIPYVKEGVKQIPKLTKQVNKLSIINTTIGKTNDVVESYKYGGIHKFEDGGKYDFVKEVKENQTGPRVEEDLYSGLYNTVETPKNLSELPSYRAYTYGANQYYAPISRPQKHIKDLLVWDEKTGANYQLNPANYKPYKEIPMTGDKSANLSRFVIDVAGKNLQQTADLHRNKQGVFNHEPNVVTDASEIKQNVFKDLYAQNLYKFKGDKDIAFKATREFVEQNVEPKFGEYYKFKQDPKHADYLNVYGDTNLDVKHLMNNLIDTPLNNYIKSKNKNPEDVTQEDLNSIIKGEEFSKIINEYKPALRDYFKVSKNLSSADTDKLIDKSFNEYYESQQPKQLQKNQYGGIQRFDDGGKKGVPTADNTNVARSYFPNPDNTNMDPRRIPQSGMVVDKRTNQAYYFGDDGDTGTFPVLTAKNPEANKNTYSLSQLAKNSNLRSTPKGYYMVEKESKYKSKDDMQHYKGLMRSLTPIKAYGESKPSASDLALHLTFTDPDNPKVFKNREHLYNEVPQKRYASYGCVNCQEPSYRAFNKAVPESDTLMMLDSKNPKDLRLLKQAQSRIKTKIKD